MLVWLWRHSFAKKLGAFFFRAAARKVDLRQKIFCRSSTKFHNYTSFVFIRIIRSESMGNRYFVFRKGIIEMQSGQISYVLKAVFIFAPGLEGFTRKDQCISTFVCLSFFQSFFQEILVTFFFSKSTSLSSSTIFQSLSEIPESNSLFISEKLDSNFC